MHAQKAMTDLCQYEPKAFVPIHSELQRGTGSGSLVIPPYVSSMPLLVLEVIDVRYTRGFCIWVLMVICVCTCRTRPACRTLS